MTNCRTCGAAIIENACSYCGSISGLPINTTAGPIADLFAQDDRLDQLDEFDSTVNDEPVHSSINLPPR